MGCHRYTKTLSGVELVLVNHVDLAGMLIEVLITQFIHHPHEDQQRCCHANSQSGNVDEGKSFLPRDVAENDSENIFNHGCKLLMDVNFV